MSVQSQELSDSMEMKLWPVINYPMLEPNLGPLQEQYMLLTAKPFLQPCQYTLSG